MGKSVKNSSTSLARTTGNVGLPSSMMGGAVDREEAGLLSVGFVTGCFFL